MIEHTTLLKDAALTNSNSNPSIFISALNTILSAYTWESNSSVNETSSLTSTYGNYYFTGNSYIKIDYCANSKSYLGINLITPNGTKRVQFGVSGHCTISVGKTDKGICICAYSGSSGSREPHFYNLYVGEITLLDGTTTKGCIYVADDNLYVVATDNGISEEATFSSIIDGTRKGYLIPVTDSTFGGTFKDIYMMACAPIQFNKMKVADKKYLCGKAFCLADE
jgi:hypothetical protein